MNTPEIVYRGRAELAEGPNWHEGALWWVDIVAGTLNRLDPATGENRARATGGFLSAAAPIGGTKWLIARQHDCAVLDWGTGKIEPFAQPREALPSGHRFNDGKCDPQGRFWVGTMSLKITPHEAGLFVLDPSGKFERVLSGLTLANGLAWSPDHRYFFHIDTPARRITRFDYLADVGRIERGETLIEFSSSDGHPDGMTIDAEGNLWVALWNGHAIANVEVRTGKILRKIDVPSPQVSCCTFGGPDLQTLFITTAWENLSLEKRIAQPLAGAIFAVRVDVPGLPVQKFGLR